MDETQLFQYIAMPLRYAGYAATLLFIWWPFLLWRRTRDSAYLWLMGAIGLIPLLQTCSGFAFSQLAGSSALRFYIYQRQYIHFARQYFMFLLLIASFICYYQALSRLAGGCMPFRDLLRWKKGAENPGSGD